MIYTISHIAAIIHAKPFLASDDAIRHLLFDSRKLQTPSGSLFFALKGERKDGHSFIPELYKKGVRNFVVSMEPDISRYPGSNFLVAPDTLNALHQLTIYHRSRFDIPVIGITGSNGKTIVKEWLYQLLHKEYNIVRSPKSFNSQIGVPLSVWQMNEQHTLGIFEAGISREGEMERLEEIIRPTIGLLTTIGEAHSEGFPSAEAKEKEKRVLFKRAELPAKLFITETVVSETGSQIRAKKDKNDAGDIFIEIPFRDAASVQNAITCWELLLFLGYPDDLIKERMKQLTSVDMRLEMKKGLHGCSIINDSYSADISSLEIALDFLEQQSAGSQKTVILSDFLQTAMPDKELYDLILVLLKKHNVSRLIAIGEHISANVPVEYEGMEVVTFLSTDDCVNHFRFSVLRDEFILVKGARMFAFERIVQLLEEKVHETVLEINLSALVHNLKEYQRHLKPSTKVMAMVKAFAYGSGGVEIAGILQYNKVDYLGVAYADEGVELRKAGIFLPIMVMNPEENAFAAIVENNLEPELYSFDILNSFLRFLEKENVEQYPVHIEIETGMNRLGFGMNDIEKLAQVLQPSLIKVQSIFSHLAAGEDAGEDAYTFSQFQKLKTAADYLQQKLNYPILQHIANSAAAIRHPDLQLSMVRLGVGLYGVDSAASGKLQLQTVATLKSTIAQIKYLKKGESVSYNRRTVLKRDSVIATIRLGYADGYPRRLGNGKGLVLIKGKKASVVGTVCMDMFMVDITDIEDVQEGAEVIIFGTGLPVTEVARQADTIPYEIMAGISQRVKRVYFQE